MSQEVIHGTAIAAIRAPQEIVVAVDSRAVNQENKPLPALVCKVQQVGKVWYIIHGMSDEAKTNFSVPSLANQALQGTNTLAEKIQAFESLVQGSLVAALEQLRKDERKGPSAIQAIAAGKAGRVVGHKKRRDPCTRSGWLAGRSR